MTATNITPPPGFHVNSKGDAESIVPDGYKMKANGDLVRIENIKAIDLVRDDFIMEVLAKTRPISEAISQYKKTVLADIAAFAQMSADEYGVSIGGDKGNINLTTIDGRYRVERSIGETLAFDERLLAAKKLVDDCVIRWESRAPDAKELAEVARRAFRVNRAGSISVKGVLELRAFNFQDEDWKRAMEIVADAIHVAGSTPYIRVYERANASAPWVSIPLGVTKG